MTRAQRHDQERSPLRRAWRPRKSPIRSRPRAPSRSARPFSLASADAQILSAAKPSPIQSLKRYRLSTSRNANARRYHQFPRLLGRTCRSQRIRLPRPGRSAPRDARRWPPLPIRNRPPASPNRSTRRGLRAGATSPVDRATSSTATAPIRRVPPVRRAIRCRGNRNQPPGRQGAQVRTAWSRPRPVSPPPRQQHWMRVVNAGAEREQCDVDDRARRHRDDPDAQTISSSRGPRSP